LSHNVGYGAWIERQLPYEQNLNIGGKGKKQQQQDNQERNGRSHTDLLDKSKTLELPLRTLKHVQHTNLRATLGEKQAEEYRLSQVVAKRSMQVGSPTNPIEERAMSPELRK
jgi:hypothetical protein